MEKLKQLYDWLDNRTGIKGHIREVLFEKVPGGSRWRYVWGSTLTFALMIQFITGIFLWTGYSPSGQTAWESVYYIDTHMTGGHFLRGLHHWTAQVMTVLLVLQSSLAVGLGNVPVGVWLQWGGIGGPFVCHAQLVGGGLFGIAGPMATLVVNVAGISLMGAIAGSIAAGISLPEAWCGIIAVGFFGALTTFSSFALGTQLAARQGIAMTAFYVGLSVDLSLAAFFATQALVTAFLGRMPT